MLPGTSRSLSRKLRNPSIQHVQPCNPRPLLSFLYTRWFADLSRDNGHTLVVRDLPASTIELAGAVDVSHATKVPKHGRARLEEAGRHGRITTLQNVLRQRTDRLPRSQLQARSSLEHSLLERILAVPTFKTARKDIETIFQELKAQEGNRKKAHLSRMQEVFSPDRIDWALTAKKLMPLTNAASQSAFVKQLDLREDFLQDHAGHVETNMWIHRVGTGAEVHFLPKADSKSGTRTVSLQGSPRSVELAEKALRLLQDRFQLSGTREAKMGTGQGLQKGTIFSVRTFSSYVTRLVQHKFPRQVQQETGETFHERVGAALVRVFLDPAASKYASTYALQRALAFVCDYDELEATADTLYERAKYLGLRMEVNNFNYLIRQAIARNNEVKARSLIADMHKAGASAIGQTWVLFFTASQTNQARYAILSYMIESMINLTSSQKTFFARNLAALRLGEMKDSPEDFSSLLDELDHLFGKDWFNGSAYSWMVHAVNRRRKTNVKKISAMLLQLPLQRAIEIDQHIEVLRFALHRHQQNTEATIEDLLSMLRKDEKPISKMHVAYAFMTAWDRKWPNVCRILWRHAASHGNIFHTMQSVVNTSLLNNASDTNYIEDVWRRNAGSVIAGTDTDMTGFETMFPRLSKHCTNLTNPMEWLTVYTPDDGTRDEQISLAYLILNRDLTACKLYQPMTNSDLLDLLNLARQTDLTWKRDKLLLKLTVSELLQQAVPTPLKRRNFRAGTEDNSANDDQKGREESGLQLSTGDTTADTHTVSLWSQLSEGHSHAISSGLRSR